MASIAGYAVTSWRGRLQVSSLEVATLDPWPGNIGVAFAIGAHQTEDASCETAVDISNNRSDTERIETLYKLTEGTGVIVVDSVGRSWSNVMVKRVTTTIAWNGATNRWRLYATWRLRPRAQEPQ